MNKKITRVISLILSVMMIFACAVTASAENILDSFLGSRCD